MDLRRRRQFLERPGAGALASAVVPGLAAGAAADLARIIRGQKASDYSREHDLAVQETLLQACRLSLK
jgi:hypothetical protein